MSTPTVWFPSELPPARAGRDLSSAQKYGRIKHIWSASRPSPTLVPGPAGHEMFRQLQEFNPATDFLSYNGGDPIALALALLALREHGLTQVEFLRYDRELDNSGHRTMKGYYVPVTIPLRPGK